MKRLTALSFPVLMALMCLTLFAQGQGGQGRGGGGRGPAAAPPATGPVADATNKIIDAINKQDAAFFDKALTADAMLADEDGHILQARIWTAKLTSSPKKIAITGLRVGELMDGGWAVFNYTLDETAQGAPNQMKGSSTIVYKKNGADLQAVLIQLSVNGRAITPH
jgi:hypothetical protein